MQLLVRLAASKEVYYIPFWLTSILSYLPMERGRGLCFKPMD